MTIDSSEETTVVATYTTRHDAEIAKSFLADHRIDSFVVADDVHVPLQLTEGARLVVMQRQAQNAYRTLVDAGLMPGNITADAYPGDDEGEEEDVSPSGDLEEKRASRENPVRKTVVAIAAATLIVMLLFFIPWRIDRTDEIMWAPVYRPPISHTTTFQELGSARTRYETGEVAFDILLLQVVGVVAAGWLASMVAGAVAQDHNLDEDQP